MRVIVVGGAAISALIVGVSLATYGALMAEKPVVKPPPMPSAAARAPNPTTGPQRARQTDATSIEMTGTISSRMAAATQALASAAAPPPAVARPPAANCAGNPNVLGVSRVVEIDTTGGPGFGFEHFKAYDFLKAGEVVLTFDDGPWPSNTQAVLTALAAHCVRATFFPIGKHAMWHPEILKQVAEKGHSIGSHTWSHADLTKKSVVERKDEIEKGISAVNAVLGGTAAPFFRFPALRHPPDVVTYLGERNIGIFSTDIDSFDFKTKKPELIVQSVLINLRKHGKGIILMHDFQHVTALALPELLTQLKANGYKVVHLTPKEPVKTVAEYDAMMSKERKGATADARPTTSVVRTISGESN